MKGQAAYLIEPQDRRIPFQRRFARHVRGTQSYYLEPQLQYLSRLDCVEAYVAGKWVEVTPVRVDLLGGYIELPDELETTKVRVTGEAYPIVLIGTLPSFEVYPETREVLTLAGESSACTTQIVGTAPGYTAHKALREAAALLYINETCRLSCFIRFEEELRRGALVWEKIYFTCEDVKVQTAPWPLPL